MVSNDGWRFAGVDFSQRLKTLMKQNGITKFKLSKQLSVSPSTVANWLNGESSPNIERVRQIADLFGVSTDYLLTGNESAAPPAKEEANAFAQMESALLKAFRTVSVSDKIAILQHAQSLAQSRALYRQLSSLSRSDDLMFAENGEVANEQLTAKDIKQIKALLRKYEEENQ